MSNVPRQEILLSKRSPDVILAREPEAGKARHCPEGHMASIAVTGAAGFLGSHVGDALLAARGGMVSYPAQAEVRRR